MNLFARTGIARLNPAQNGAAGMRVVATGLLVFMACVYLLAKSQQDVHPAWGFVRAFAEGFLQLRRRGLERLHEGGAPTVVAADPARAQRLERRVGTHLGQLGAKEFSRLVRAN